MGAGDLAPWIIVIGLFYVARSIDRATDKLASLPAAFMEDYDGIITRGRRCEYGVCALPPPPPGAVFPDKVFLLSWRSSARGGSADILGVPRSYVFTSFIQRKSSGVSLGNMPARCCCIACAQVPCVDDHLPHAVPPVLLPVPVSRSRTAWVLMASAV